MTEQARRLTELDGEDADQLVETALETEYVDRLQRYLSDEYDEELPTENRRAFERDDGVQAITFSDGSGGESRPDLAITIHVDEGTVVQATGERRGSDVDGAVELLFPAEIAPDPEAAVNDILEARGQSVAVDVDKSGDVTTYTIEP